MKQITEFLFESFESDVKNCKTFGDFFCLYNGVDSIDEYEEDNFKMSDAATLFNREGMKFDEFIKWVKSIADKTITKPNVKQDGTVKFKLDNELFDLEWTEY